MYIPASERPEKESTIKRGVSLDYLGEPPAPLLPCKKRFWTIEEDYRRLGEIRRAMRDHKD